MSCSVLVLLSIAQRMALPINLLTLQDAALALDPHKALLYLVQPTPKHPVPKPAPPGIRTYYLNRSQPPLFSDMVRIVYEATGNRTLLR